MTTTLVVGVDGSAQSLTAVEWAAAEASRRKASLRAVCVTTPGPPDAESILDKAVSVARPHIPAPHLTTAVATGQPAAALIESATDASILIVGSRGRGGRTGLLLGSVALQVASHAPCPVISVRGNPRPTQGEVVVGIDGSPGSKAALDFAFKAAQVRSDRLRAVRAWTTPPPDATPHVPDPDLVADAEVETDLANALAEAGKPYPDVRVIPDAHQARPVRALTTASTRADLLVVGARGRGGFKNLLLGSVANAMLHRSACPVAVVHP
ncbi:universal stress protein [Actinomadura rayongensis]|uniref:Universal stress protein n=1 Tax=Actinomadura rayongensis TaxID=1429076 RepID=A0A6I4W9J2_9ACTN|nr:universal stress protein [Actinomadura rayongensis]